MRPSPLKAPYPFFGGKSRVADLVWRRFGDITNYVEPFAGSLAVLLARPVPFAGTETVNDLNGWICNLWRALQADPDGVAHHADWPVSELDLHARGDWLFYRPGVEEWIEQLRADPGYYDVKSAGWWVWGQCAWIGGGWGQLPHLGDAGRGINRKLPHLGDAGRDDEITPRGEALRLYLRDLSERLRGVRVCCGDWTRVLGPTPTVKLGTTAVFLDPPYGVVDRANVYDAHDDYAVSAAVRQWAIAHGDDPRLRIALAGYEGEHAMPDTWEVVTWKAVGGYENQAEDGERSGNCRRERLWFSPHCDRQPTLFDGLMEVSS